jgi:hypothetical protein
MSHNASQRRRRYCVMNGSIEEFSEWTLTITYGTCRHICDLPARDAHRRHLSALALLDAGCAQPPASVTIAVSRHEIVLIGRGFG